MGLAFAWTAKREEWLAVRDQDLFTSMYGKGAFEVVGNLLPSELMDELVVRAEAMANNE